MAYGLSSRLLPQEAQVVLSKRRSVFFSFLFNSHQPLPHHRMAPYRSCAGHNMEQVYFASRNETSSNIFFSGRSVLTASCTS